MGKTNINKDHRPDPANFKTPGTKLAKEGTWLAASNFVHVSGVSASYKSKTVPNNGRLTLELGGTYSISLSTSSGSRYSLTWYSGDTNIFTVNSSKGAGAVIKATPVKAGSAELKIYSPHRREYTIQVQVPDKKFTIKYEANGGKGATMKDTVVHYGQKVTTTKCTYTRDGYSFGGWYVYSDKKKQYMYKSSSGNRFMSDAEAARHKYPKSIYSNGTPLAKTTDIDGDVLRFKAVWNALPSLSSASVTLVFDKLYVYRKRDSAGRNGETRKQNPLIRQGLHRFLFQQYQCGNRDRYHYRKRKLYGLRKENFYDQTRLSEDGYDFGNTGSDLDRPADCAVRNRQPWQNASDTGQRLYPQLFG